MTNLERIPLGCGHNPEQNTQSVIYTRNGNQEEVESATLQTSHCTKRGNLKNGGTCATLKTNDTFSEICGEVPNDATRIALAQTLRSLLILKNHNAGFAN